MSLNKSIHLTSLGNTIVDLEYRVDEATLTALGIEKGSMSLIDTDKKHQLMSELGDPVHRCSGGSAANSIFVAQQWGLTTHHLGVIGTDELGEFTKNDYAESGILNDFDTTQTDGDTGCCLVLITPDGERSMLTHLGVSADFKPGAYLDNTISRSEWLFIEGYLLANDTVLDLINTTIIPLATQHHTKLILTLSDAGLVTFFKDRFLAFLNHPLAMVFANASEATAISGIHSFEPALFFNAPETIITDGKNGAKTITKTEIIHHQTTAIAPVDTTGAGDAFAGTYIAQRIQKNTIEISGQTANQLAAIVISHYGARPEALLSSKIPKTLYS
ncbi:MAG: adenosine kinase [Candidatus Marinamargulisbacteria bacterium]